MTQESEKVTLLREQITDLKKHWPAHTVPPGLMQQLDDLEEALEQALQEDEGSVNEDLPPLDDHP
jgi:hypothetical protein